MIKKGALGESGQVLGDNGIDLRLCYHRRFLIGWRDRVKGRRDYGHSKQQRSFYCLLKAEICYRCLYPYGVFANHSQHKKRP